MGLPVVVVVDVLGNDVDADGDLAPATLQVTEQPASGAAEAVAGDGALGPAVRFTAGESSGTVSFACRMCDRLRACLKATVSVVVGTSGCAVMGTSAAETLRGTPGDDVICGGDILKGRSGDDAPR